MQVSTSLHNQAMRTSHVELVADHASPSGVAQQDLDEQLTCATRLMPTASAKSVKEHSAKKGTLAERLCTGSKTRFWTSAIFCLCFCSWIWIAVTTFGPEPVGLLQISGRGVSICARQTVCAEDWYSLLLLGISRSTAYFTYPLMMLVFLSKTNNLRTLLQRTVLSIWIPFHDLHALHTFAGRTVSVAVAIHAVCHVLRWAIQGNAWMLYRDQTGQTGAISILVTPLITLPMLMPALKRQMSWEIRKGMHTVCALIWVASIAFHAPAMWILGILGIPGLIYVIDYVAGTLFRTFSARDPILTRLDCGVEIDFEHPPGFVTDGTGYVLLCLPWISPFQWHAFSLFRHPTKEGHSCVCINKAGDWTEKLHSLVEKRTSRPLWIAGPYASPYSCAVNFDNLILVASGIGITPAMSIVTSLKDSRRVHLIWACRDPALLEFYLEKCIFDDDAWTLVYYTGKRKLVLPANLPPTVFVFNGRPDFDRTVREMVVGCELGCGLPENVVAAAEDTIGEFHTYSKSLATTGLAPAERFDNLIRKELRTHGNGLLEHIQLKLQAANKTELNADAARKTLSKHEFTIAIDSIVEPGHFNDSEVDDLIRRFDVNSSGDVDVGELLSACHAAISVAMRVSLEESPETTVTKDSEKKPGEWAARRFAPLPLGGRKGYNKISKHKDEEGGGITAHAVASSDPSVFIDAVGVDRLAVWGMFYCGGSQPVVEALRTIETRYGIGLGVEKFDW